MLYGGLVLEVKITFNVKKSLLNFYTKITFWGSLVNKLMGKKQIWAKKYFWGVMGPPPKKYSGI